MKYKFSVIIPIYNVEKYLEECIESVINQSIGFNNIQIILVNDGSIDNSEDICLKYSEKYENIIYIKQENSGVSKARNNGLKYALGEYINFLDGDDKWEDNVFFKVYNMFSNNDIDIIGVRQKYFEALDIYPSLDFKFNKDKIASIFENYDHIQLSVTSAFIRKSSIGNIRFDEKVKYSEDAKFLNEIIIKKEKLGLIASSLHYYRKRLSENSAIQSKNNDIDWYLTTPIRCYKYSFELSKKKYGYVIPYFMYYIAYEYQWRIREIIPNNIDKNTMEKYLKITKNLFKNIDDNIILEQERLSIEYKIELLNFKYNKDITKYFKYRDKYLYYNGYKILDFKNKKYLTLNILNFKNNNIEIRGMINLPINKNEFNINIVVDNNKRIPLNILKTNVNTRYSFNKEFISNYGFKVEIPTKFKSIYFELIYKDLYKTKIRFNCGINSKIDCNSKNYYIFNNYIYYYYNDRIKTRKLNLKNKLYFNCRYIKNIIKSNNIKTLIYRSFYSLLKKCKKNEIWIITDRVESANDNGLSLFKYVCKNKNKKIKVYFAISKNSMDYNKVKKIGRVLNLNSIKYKLYFLLADKIISSQADPWVTNPFGKKNNYYKDLYNSDFVFLQHGITKNDLSSWLNCYEKNIKLFITAVKKEYKSIIEGSYGFGKNIVKLTGFPRYDNLVDNKEKLIAIMPTWRISIASNINKDGIRPYNNKFNKSKYFKFYNKLINDKKLINVMNK